MSRSQPRLKRCVYCLGWFKRRQITRDHIFSRSWNPDKRPTHQWTVSSCQNCNGAFGKIEIALRDQLAICLVPNNPVAHAAIRMALANFNPLLAKTEIDARARAKRQRQLFAEARLVFTPPPKGALPFTLANLHEEGYGIKIPVNPDDLVKVVQKWTRGVHFELTGGFIEPDHEIRPFWPDKVQEGRLIATVQPIMECHSLNLSVQVMHAAIPDEMGREPIHLYGFNIWQQYRAYSWVLDPTASQELFATR